MKAFISYCHEDQEQADGLVAGLGKVGVDCFIDRSGIRVGAPIAERIKQELASCDLLVAVLSRNSGTSGWVPFEIGFAMGSGKPVLPLRLRPHEPLPWYVEGLRYVETLDEVKRIIGEERAPATPADVVRWLRTRREHGGFENAIEVGIVSPDPARPIDAATISVSGFVRGCSAPDGLVIQGFVRTNRQYPQGASRINARGYWNIREVHLGASDHELSFEVRDAAGQVMALSEEVRVTKVDPS